MAKEKTKQTQSGTSIADVIKELNKKIPGADLMMLGSNKTMKVESSPTGSFGLDIALGVGGYPKGRLIEISGPESSGKTTLALHGVVEAQQKGGVCAYIDTEHALDPEYARNIGVDIKSLLISQPENGEDALDVVEGMVRCGQFALIVVDSVASLTPKKEIEGDMSAQQVGLHAKLMSHACRKLAPIINKSKTIVIFINQIRMNIGMVFPGQSPEFTTGGKALKFYSSVRLDIRRIAQIKKGDEVVGGRTRVKVVKNKVAAPYKQTEFDIMYGEGISKQGEVLALGEKFNIINREGQSYLFGEEKLGRGYDASRNFLKENPKVMKDITEKIKEAFKKPVTVEAELEDNTTSTED